MKIIAISDTHLQHWSLSIPLGDVLVHAGDALTGGRKKEWEDFSKWWNAQPHPHKIYVPGNHDIVCETDMEWARAGLKDTHFLVDEGVTIEGKLFWGSPWQRPFNDWAFNRYDDVRFEKFSKIPKSTIVLVTHAPPLGFLDRVDGEKDELGDNVLGAVTFRQDALPPIHIFGHIHSGYGVGIRSNHHSQGLVANAAICNEGYKPVNAPLTLYI